MNRRAPAIAAVVGVAVLALVVVLVISPSERQQSDPGRELIGNVAPALTGTTLTGDRFDIDEHRGQWVLVKAHLYREKMMALVRALKQVATEEQVIAYRRRRPYIHFGPVEVQPAKQDVLGAWTLGEPRHLYLTPVALVLLAGDRIKRLIPLEAVQQVSAIRRIDQPKAPGLVRFEADGKPLAFALQPHEAFAAALAEAAKRTLEDPVQWQRKKKKGETIALEDEDL